VEAKKEWEKIKFFNEIRFHLNLTPVLMRRKFMKDNLHGLSYCGEKVLQLFKFSVVKITMKVLMKNEDFSIACNKLIDGDVQGNQPNEQVLCRILGKELEEIYVVEEDIVLYQFSHCTKIEWSF
jgi:hypothetical protein